MDTISNGHFYYSGISITDWIQALGALIAVIAGIYAFFKLFTRDKDKEKQIQSLTEIAKQSAMQTQQLFSQAGHMEESNRLFREQIEVLKERTLAQKSEQELAEKEKEIVKRIRKNDIKPIFYQENGIGAFNWLKIEIANKGGQCKLLKVDMIEGGELLAIDKRINDTILSNGDVITLLFNSLNNSMNANNFVYTFDLKFENIDGNRYSQRFSCKGITCKIGQPLELN